MQKKPGTFTRRAFLKGAALATSTLTLSPKAYAQLNGSNSEVRCAVVGVRGRGRNHISGLAKLKGVRVVALCDVDTDALDQQTRKLKVPVYTDIRKLLEAKDIDAISIASPNHWHALGAIWAIQSGKDVYLEKPVSHNVSEGRRIVEFARASRKIVQAGTQSRSNPGIHEALAWLREGHLGKILLARGLCYKPRPSIGRVDGPTPIPKNINYDLWCGPADKLPLRRANLHYDWHWDFNTGNGDLGNQGIHQMDLARMFLGQTALAPRVWSVGERLGYIDDGNTPNTLFVYHDYPVAPLVFEVRGLTSRSGSSLMDKYRGAGIGVVIECENGYLTLPSYSTAVAHDAAGREFKRFRGTDNHYKNFIKAVRSRNHADLSADILEGHLSSALCHTGNISYQLGHHRSPAAIREAIRHHPGADASFERMVDHLQLNEINLDQNRLRLGPPLRMNPDTEQFIDDEIANALLTRNYRRGFELPDQPTG